MNNEKRVADLGQRVKNIEKEATAATMAITNRKCSVCKERHGAFHCDDDSWICETCAQVMSELGNELN
ncbi:hypothetical protein [Siminovitchia sp. FSL W7-1587]|uniref:hypothetical protein n=1 Tax=Siminovitchia sp. FSL W7-1587 TaxID=2954699 RepID=UPI0030CC051D